MKIIDRGWTAQAEGDAVVVLEGEARPASLVGARVGVSALTVVSAVDGLFDGGGDEAGGALAWMPVCGTVCGLGYGLICRHVCGLGHGLVCRFVYGVEQGLACGFVPDLVGGRDCGLGHGLVCRLVYGVEQGLACGVVYGLGSERVSGIV